MLKVGLTGSIAVGKTFVCGVLAELGCTVLDADKTAREVVERGTEGLERIVREFGHEVLDADGALDRKRLGAIVFGDPAKRALLNSIVHPLVIERQDRWLSEQEGRDPEGIAVIDAALMIESSGYKRFDQLIVVWCEADVQLRRLMERDKLTETEARRRIEAQMPQSEKKKYADHLINTSLGFEDTRRQTEDVFRVLRGSVRASN
ncbi:MAG TPA: dephospho-CoA kinase [Pyrinomonadaceae bacterium]|nr:dephospho-CoA kinase [Pyrinomonadaceae bacterium]